MDMHVIIWILLFAALAWVMVTGLLIAKIALVVIVAVNLIHHAMWRRNRVRQNRIK